MRQLIQLSKCREEV